MVSAPRRHGQRVPYGPARVSLQCPSRRAARAQPSRSDYEPTIAGTMARTIVGAVAGTQGAGEPDPLCRLRGGGPGRGLRGLRGDASLVGRGAAGILVRAVPLPGPGVPAPARDR